MNSEYELAFYPWVIFLGSILSVASCSIGIGAINKLPKDSQKTNKMYLIVILVISLLIMLYGCYDIYKHFTRSD